MESNPKTHSAEKALVPRHCYLPVLIDKPLLLDRMVLEFNTFSEEKYSVGKHCKELEA